MRKIFYALVIAFLVLVVYLSGTPGTIQTSGINSTYKRLMFVYADSLTSTLKPIKMGNEEATPLEISTTGLNLLSTNRFYIDTHNYIYSPSDKNLSISADDSLYLFYDKLKFSSGGYIDGSDNLVLIGNVTAVDGTFSDDLVVTDDATISGETSLATLAVSSTSAFTGAITAGAITASGAISGNVTGNLTGNVTSTGANSFGTITTTGTLTTPTVACTTATVSGSATVGTTLGVTEVLTATGGLKAGTISEITDTGVTIDGLLLKDGNVDLNGDIHKLIIDADADTYIHSKQQANQIFYTLNGADDFQMTANTFTALSGSSILTDTMNETTSSAGVTVEGACFENLTSVFSLLAPDGKYIAITSAAQSDAYDPTSNGLTDRQDLFIAGKLEVDGAAYMDGALTVAGLLTMDDMYFSGGASTIIPSGTSANELSVQGGAGTTNGGALYLDGGNATTDGNVIVGRSYGNLDIQTLWGESSKEVLTLDDEVVNTDLLTYQTTVIATTDSDTLIIGGTPFEGLIKQYILKSCTTDTVKIEAGTYDCNLDANGESVRYKYIDSVWYIIGKNN
jgi:hypothetical protein